MPGWLPGSWGYHGDDGMILIGDCFGRCPSEDFGYPGFGAGDTVGVCLNMETGGGLCTLNGNKLAMGEYLFRTCVIISRSPNLIIGDIFKDYRGAFQFGKIYPCVGFDMEPEGIDLMFRVNLGGSKGHPFKYKYTDAFDFD